MKKLEINKWDKYWRLKVVKEVEAKNGRRRFLFECECMVLKEICIDNIIYWNTRSCWCLCREKTRDNFRKHWKKYTRIYRIWENMKTRCDNINHPAYKDYWWRWITYDKKWEKFEWFYEDMKEWYDESLTIDREDNNWNYNKNNCRWITRKQQARNTRKNKMYKWKCLSEWCEIMNLNYNTVKNRINWLWWSIEKALFNIK